MQFFQFYYNAIQRRGKVIIGGGNYISSSLFAHASRVLRTLVPTILAPNYSTIICHLGPQGNKNGWPGTTQKQVYLSPQYPQNQDKNKVYKIQEHMEKIDEERYRSTLAEEGMR